MRHDQHMVSYRVEETARTDNVKSLDQLLPDDEPRVGAKAYNCARLRRAGFHVPDGVVVLASATDAEAAAASRHAWFAQEPEDARYAVRSSAIGEDSAGQSFAGIHQTLLDVARAQLPSAIEACRASAHAARALAYRRASGLPAQAMPMAVLVQRMVSPVAAGVGFTLNPVSGDTTEVVINAACGVGDALVDGRIDPDEFVIRKQDGALTYQRVGDKGAGPRGSIASLTIAQVRELGRLLIDVERHYNAPQDVEWCHDGRAFWIVQSRPVTAVRQPIEETEWTRANLAEVLPDLTSPQALDAFEDLLNRAERQHLGRLLSRDPAVGPMVKAFAGRLYFNLSQLRHVCAVTGTPAAWMLRALGHPGAIQRTDETPRAAPLMARLAVVPDLARLTWSQLRAAQVIRAHEQRCRAALDRFARTEPGRLPDRAVWSEIDAWAREGPEFMQPVLLLGSVLMQELALRRFCERAGIDFERLVFPQLAAGTPSVSGQLAFDLVALAEAARREDTVVRAFKRSEVHAFDVNTAFRGTAFLARFERFLEIYGHRGRFESDWALPRYREDPAPLLQAIRAHLEGEAAPPMEETSRRQEREAAAAWTEFAGRLSGWRRPVWLARARRSIRTIRRFYAWREQVRSDIVRVLGAVRRWHLVLAARFVERGWLDARDDYFLLRLEEVGAAIAGHSPPEALRPLAVERHAELERYRGMAMPLLMRESELARLIRTAAVSDRAEDQRQLTGHPVSGGCVEGDVVVVRDPADFRRMKRGAILVAPATDPSWTPLFTLAAGVIVEVGGVLSHASTVAREFGLPALANVRQATRRLKTGDRVRLDATNGVVTRLERPGP